MDQTFLSELIAEVQARSGGLVLNLNEKPAAVVLSLEKYNQLLGGVNSGQPTTERVTPDNILIPEDKLVSQHNNPHRHVLVTGGAGYIGTHLVRQLVKENIEVTVLDNLSSGKRENIPAGVNFVEGDVGDINLLRDVFASAQFEAVFHLAASLEVEESVREPQKYLENNAINTAKLLSVMAEANVKKIIFSSTAAVYGTQEEFPLKETTPARPNNPYGASKLLAEQIIKYYARYFGFKAVIFRYFNACGCDFLGDVALTHFSHLIPIVLDVAKGKKSQVTVYGNDYQTFDGTCIRDYVHVLDIAGAHLAALDKIDAISGFEIYNIGTGKGLSVKEVIAGASELLNKIIPMEIGSRRAGDAMVSVADNTKLIRNLGFTLSHSDLQTIISTSWKQMEYMESLQSQNLE